MKKVLNSDDVWTFFIVVPKSAQELPVAALGGHEENGKLLSEDMRADVCGPLFHLGPGSTSDDRLHSPIGASFFDRLQSRRVCDVSHSIMRTLT